VQITHSVQAEGAEAAVGDAIEKTIAAVKSAASSESDCDTVHNASGRTRVDVGWHSQMAVNNCDAQLSHH